MAENRPSAWTRPDDECDYVAYWKYRTTEAETAIAVAAAISGLIGSLIGAGVVWLLV